jgi:hypothetical protein
MMPESVVYAVLVAVGNITLLVMVVVIGLHTSFRGERLRFQF